MKIAKNFTWKEVACNKGECPHCGGANPVNPLIIEIAQEIRNEVSAPVSVSSGFRCLIHNKKVGGAKNSLHTYGLALDLHTPKSGHYSNVDDFHNYVQNSFRWKEDFLGWFYMSGLGLYPWGVHIDVRHLFGMKPKRWVGK